ASVACPREKSLTRPLPSVFARTAITPAGSICFDAIAAAMPLTSSGALAEMRGPSPRLFMEGFPFCAAASRAIERAAIVRTQRVAQFGHGRANVGRRSHRLAQGGEQLGLQRRQVDTGNGAVTYDLAAGGAQLLHLLPPRRRQHNRRR